jgi:hypothetical protein
LSKFFGREALTLAPERRPASGRFARESCQVSRLAKVCRNNPCGRFCLHDCDHAAASVAAGWRAAVADPRLRVGRAPALTTISDRLIGDVQAHRAPAYVACS